MSEELSMLIKRCLCYGIKIYPHQLNGIVNRYGKYKIPDDVLSKLKEDKLKDYVRGLYLSSCEDAGSWTRGHKILKTLGFQQKERIEGHRVYVSMVWGDGHDIYSTKS